MTDTRNAGANIIAALRTPVATLKTCKTCGETKLIDDFSKSGKRRGVQEYRASCKLCMMTDENRKRIELRNEGLKQCTCCGQVKSLDDFYDDKRKLDVRATGRWNQQENVRKRLWDAVRRNGFPRPTEHKCTDCGQPAQEYHHESYEREHWLDVVPLCRECHRSRHSAERN